MYKIAIRGVPTFAYVFYETYQSLDEFFSTVTVKASESVGLGIVLNYFRGCKRIIPYISSDTLDPSVLAEYCLENVPRGYLRESSLSGSFITITPETGALRCSGTTSSIRPGRSEYYGILPSKHPDASSVHADAVASREIRRKQRKLEEELQEQQYETLNSLLLEAVEQVGFQNVKKTLENL